jgi:hypothetical protein
MKIFRIKSKKMRDYCISIQFDAPIACRLRTRGKAGKPTATSERHRRRALRLVPFCEKMVRRLHGACTSAVAPDVQRPGSRGIRADT